MDLQMACFYLLRRQSADSGGPFRRRGDGTFGGLLDESRAQQIRVRLFRCFFVSECIKSQVPIAAACLCVTTQELG